MGSGKKADESRTELMLLIKNNFAVLIDYWAVDWDYDGHTFKSLYQELRGNGRKTKVVSTEAENIYKLSGKRKSRCVWLTYSAMTRQKFWRLKFDMAKSTSNNLLNELPLVKGLESEVKSWAQMGWQGASQTTYDLLSFWFNRSEDEGLKLL